VTLYVPSDFKGTFRLSHPSSHSAPSVRLSPAFNKEILPHTAFAAAQAGEDPTSEDSGMDGVRVCAPVLNLRVWDVLSASPERKPNGAKGVIKRLLRPQAPVRTAPGIDWDFLLD
jgi:hypothetical protein